MFCVCVCLCVSREKTREWKLSYITIKKHLIVVKVCCKNNKFLIESNDWLIVEKYGVLKHFELEKLIKKMWN